MTERTMKSVNQQNPADPTHAVSAVFRRGPVVAADGGERGVGKEQKADAEDAAETADDAPAAADQQLKHVDQTPPDEDASANSVWERGGEPTPDDESGDDE